MKKLKKTYVRKSALLFKQKLRRKAKVILRA